MQQRGMWQWIHATIYSGHVKFFRVRLLTLSPDEIAQLVESYEKDVKKIKTESLKMTWYMRGGVTYNEVMQMSADERSVINEIIKENLEITKKSKLPFF